MEHSERESLEQAAVVAHQIKSPVGTLHTILRTLLGGFAGELSEPQRKMLESADRKCSETMDTIRGLLALAEASAHPPAGVAADLVAATRRALDRYQQSATEKGLTFDSGIALEEAYVSADPVALEEAVAALVDNAIKYTPASGNITLRVSSGAHADEVQLTISDSGIGVPDDEREHLFRPFFRARNARELMPAGTGLGLPFVKAVVTGAGGSIAASRSEMGGAEFTISLPRVARPAAVKRDEHQPSFRVVVIGGVAAGPKVASKIVRLRADAHVTIIERGRVLAYAGCGLPYYISGLVKDQRMLVSTPEGVVRGLEFFESVKNVRVVNRTEAVQIDRANHKVLVRDLLSGEQTWLPYDKLVLATGAVPIVPDIPGVHLANVFSLHGLEHAEGIKSNLSEGRAKDVTIVGGGLIGVEMTESLVAAGCRVTLVEMRPQLLPMLDSDMAEVVRRHFEAKGVRVLLNTRVTGFEGDGKVKRVLTDNDAIPADMVILGVGVRPNVRLAVEAGIELGETGAIKVDEHMRTSDPDVYATGDCVECCDILTGRPVYAPFGSTANKQGRVAAISICGGEDAFPGVLATAVCQVFDYTVARAGLTERRARELGYEIVSALIPALDRAHFMPNAEMIILKVICDARTRKLLGIQAVGPGEAAKRVDVAVTAMTGGLTVDAISNLDLCYAPSYSDALDNLHVACNVLKNKLAGQMVGITPLEVKQRRDGGEDVLLLDVRTRGEFELSHIEGAKHIPLATLRARLEEIPRDREIITFSRVSLGGYEAAIILKAHGFANVKVMDGGLMMWPFEKLGE